MNHLWQPVPGMSLVLDCSRDRSRVLLMAANCGRRYTVEGTAERFVP